MSKPVLILAAHGAGNDSPANQSVHQLADRLKQTNRFHSVAPAFNKGIPRFAEILDRLDLDSAIVVPLMTAAGYFSQSFLPTELQKNNCCHDMNLHITEPIGTHPDLKTITASRTREILTENNLDNSPTTIITIGHGTKRSETSKQSNESLADHLRHEFPSANVVTAYLDDEPHITKVVATIPPTHNILAIPFLIGGGSHATDDIPDALNLKTAPKDAPVIERHNSRTVLCDIPTGRLPELTDIILDLAAAPAP